MFSKKGIASHEIENAFGTIEEETNFILEKLKTNLSVEFKPDREITKLEDYCSKCGWQYPKSRRVKKCEECDAKRVKQRKDEMQLRVLENGEDMGFHLESGGGKFLVSIAVRIALALLKRREKGSRFNVIWLDEVDSSFDAVNRKHLIDLITKVLIKELGFEQVFIVSHSETIKESVPDVLKVLRYENYAKVGWL